MFIRMTVVALWAAVVILASEEVAPLPEDELQASTWVSAGLLDSTLWKTLEPFYRHPISVPQGELRYLKDLIPGAFEQVPWTAKSLARYEPWDEEAKQAFFRDYPQLEPLEPILCFRYREGARLGLAGVSLRSVAFDSKYPNIRATLHLKPDPNLRFDGSGRFSEYDARWIRRKLSIECGAVGRVQVGNFTTGWEDGLVVGRFADGTSSPDALQSWLESDLRTWNGVLWSMSSTRNSRLSVLAHHRATETIAAAHSRCDIYKGTFFESGFFAADVRGDGLSYRMAVRTTAGWKHEGWNMRLTTACTGENPFALPVHGRISHRTGGHGFSGEYLLFPSGFVAPLSRELYLVRRETALPDSHETGALQRIRFRFDHRISSTLRVSPGVQLTSSEWGIPVDGWIEASGTAPFRYGISYCLKSRGFVSTQQHRFRASLHHRWGRFSALARGYAMISDAPRRSGSVSARMSWNPAYQPIEFSFQGCLDADNRGRRDVWAGYRQHFTWFDKTWGEFVVEAPVDKDWRGGIRASSTLVFAL